MSLLQTIVTRAKNIVLYGSYIPTDYYILEAANAVYISIPKVACTSIKIATMGSNVPIDSKNNYMDIHSLAERYHTFSLTSAQKKYYTFAFVRSPFDRLVSCFEDKVRRPVQHHGRYFFDSAYNDILLKRFIKVNFSPDMSFDEFIKSVAKIPDFLSDGHFRSQYSMLYSGGHPIPDYIGKFEDLPESWLPVAKQCGFPELDQKNQSERESLSRYFGTVELLKLVRKRYMKDIKLFGYEDQYTELLTDLNHQN